MVQGLTPRGALQFDLMDGLTPKSEGDEVVAVYEFITLHNFH